MIDLSRRCVTIITNAHFRFHWTSIPELIQSDLGLDIAIICFFFVRLHVNKQPLTSKYLQYVRAQQYTSLEEICFFLLSCAIWSSSTALNFCAIFSFRIPITYWSYYVSLIEMVCYKQSSTPTQSFRESKLYFSRLFWVLHDDQIETKYIRDFCYIKLFYFFNISFFFKKKNTPRQKIAASLISQSQIDFIFVAVVLVTLFWSVKQTQTKKKFRVPHEESNPWPSDPALRCSDAFNGLTLDDTLKSHITIGNKRS